MLDLERLRLMFDGCWGLPTSLPLGVSELRWDRLRGLIRWRPLFKRH